MVRDGDLSLREEAVQDYTRIIQSDQSYPEAYFGRGCLLLGRNRVKEGLVDQSLGLKQLNKATHLHRQEKEILAGIETITSNLRDWTTVTVNVAETLTAIGTRVCEDIEFGVWRLTGWHLRRIVVGRSTTSFMCLLGSTRSGTRPSNAWMRAGRLTRCSRTILRVEYVVQLLEGFFMLDREVTVGQWNAVFCVFQLVRWMRNSTCDKGRIRIRRWVT